MSDIQNLQDKLFKSLFSRKEAAREYFEKCLPEPLAAKLDFSTLRLSEKSYVNESLKEFFSDLVYQCETEEGEALTIPLILEHKSWKPPYPPLQILQYQINGWQMQVNDQEKPTPIIPIIFYHGKEKWDVKPWKNYLRGMSPVYEPYTPEGGYVFTDLSDMSDEDIQSFRDAFMKTSMLLMKHRFEQQYLLNNLRHFFIFVENEEDWEGKRIEVQLIILYLKETINLTWEQFENGVRDLPRTKNSAMTVYEDILQKGIKEGRKEGRKEGLNEGIELILEVISLLKNKPSFSDKEISEQAGVSEDLVKKIRLQISDDTKPPKRNGKK
jgi:predicted transposase/invertase (TIGR01784 family)